MPTPPTPSEIARLWHAVIWPLETAVRHVRLVVGRQRLVDRTDREIVADQSFCRTDSAKKACASHPSSECERFAAQVKPSAHTKLASCIADGFDAYSCAEGASTL